MKCAKRSLGDFIRDALPPEVNLSGRMFEGECGCTECITHALLEAGIDGGFVHEANAFGFNCSLHPTVDMCLADCAERQRAAVIISRWRP